MVNYDSTRGKGMFEGKFRFTVKFVGEDQTMPFHVYDNKKKVFLTRNRLKRFAWDQMTAFEQQHKEGVYRG